MSAPKRIHKEGWLGRLRVVFEWRRGEFWGRFGGGWNWKFGFQIGGTCLILNLLFCSLRFEIMEQRKAEA